MRIINFRWWWKISPSFSTTDQFQSTRIICPSKEKKNINKFLIFQREIQLQRDVNCCSSGEHFRCWRERICWWKKIRMTHNHTTDVIKMMIIHQFSTFRSKESRSSRLNFFSTDKYIDSSICSEQTRERRRCARQQGAAEGEKNVKSREIEKIIFINSWEKCRNDWTLIRYFKFQW